MINKPPTKRLVSVISMIPYLLSLTFGVLYVFMQTLSVYAGDSGELVAAAYTFGIAHPPGYPLYTIIGGLLAHGLPILTPAWRVGLLSSIPSAISLFFLWKIIQKITKSDLSATVITICCGVLYPVWLYAIVPEVFGLFTLFSMLLIYVYIRWIETEKISFLYLLFFLLGLSATHHHMIIFLWIAIGVDMLRKKQYVNILWKNKWPLILFGILGLSFYVYAPIASSRFPPFDWEHPATLDGFIRLVTRASYGTFRASQNAGQSLIDRFLNVMTFFQYVWKDFTLLGVIGIFVGWYGLWKLYKNYTVLFIVYFGLQVFYFFYAGFPVSSDFALGTLERFFIVPYFTLALFMGFGVATLIYLLQIYWKEHTDSIHIPYQYLIAGILVIYMLLPIRSIGKNYHILALLHDDKTIEHLADDIFLSVPEHGLLNLSHDTSVFAVNYAYFVQKKRQDIQYVYFPQLQYFWYRESLRKRYPDLIVPMSSSPVSFEEYLKTFLLANASKRAILDEDVNKTVNEYWVPRGLVFMFYPTLESIPNRESLLEKNTSLWQSFHDPLQGVLGTYKHLMMTDVLRYYAYKRSLLAEAYVYRGDITAVEREMTAILGYDPKQVALYLKYIDLLLDDANCEKAYTLNKIPALQEIPIEQRLSVYHNLYTVCPIYKKEFQQFEDKYQQLLESSGIPIE